MRLPRECLKLDMKIFIPSDGPQSWQGLLADPEKQWRDGYSAKMMAESWERAQGFPSEVRDLLASSPEPALAEATPLIGIPEYQVPLAGRGRPSQNDLFVLAAAGTSPAATRKFSSAPKLCCDFMVINTTSSSRKSTWSGWPTAGIGKTRFSCGEANLRPSRWIASKCAPRAINNTS